MGVLFYNLSTSLNTRMGIKSSPEQIWTWSKGSSGVENPLLFSTILLLFSCSSGLCGTHHTFYNELSVDVLFVRAVCLCSAIWVPPNLIEKRILKHSLTHLRVCHRCLHVPSLPVENTFSVHAIVETTEHLGNPNCARAERVDRNSPGPGCGKNPHLVRRSGLVENWNSFCFSAQLPARCIACPLSVLFSVDNARMLTHILQPFRDSKTLAHPISQQIHSPMKNFHMVAELCWLVECTGKHDHSPPHQS